MRRPAILGLIIMVLALSGGWSLAQAALTYTTVSYTYNGFNQERDPNYPQGNVTLGGIPFDIPVYPDNNNTWDSINGGSGTMVLEIPLSIYGVEEVHTLINNSWGMTGGPYAWLEFWGSGGAYYKKDLYGNVDIRDWFDGEFTNSINNTTTTNVYSGDGRTDKQQITLPVDFEDEYLTLIKLTDVGSQDNQRTFLYGVTVGANPVPLPGGLLLLGSGLMGFIAYRRRKDS